MAFLPAIPAALASIFSTTAATAATTTAAAAGTTAASAAVSSIPLATGALAFPTAIEAATVPGWVSAAATAASVASGAVGAYGAVKQGEAASNAAKFNASVAAQNAELSKQNANIAGQAGAEQAFISGMGTKAKVGAIVANQAAGNIDANTGSAKDVSLSEKETGYLDALTIRSNATRSAFSYGQEAKSFESESTLAKYEAQNDSTGGDISGASTFLGAAGNASSNWAKFQMNGGFYA